jgi:Zn-finger protein
MSCIRRLSVNFCYGNPQFALSSSIRIGRWGKETQGQALRISSAAHLIHKADDLTCVRDEIELVILHDTGYVLRI